MKFDSSGVIVPTRNGGAMTGNRIAKMHVLPTIITEAPTFVTSAQAQSHSHNHNNCNKLFHIISLNSFNKFIKRLSQRSFFNQFTIFFADDLPPQE
jgi:hypothetical protein